MIPAGGPALPARPFSFPPAAPNALMGFKAKHLPGFIQAPLAAAARAAMTGPLVAGLGPSLAVAKSLAGLVPRVQAKRFERAVRNLRHAFPAWDDARIQRTALGAYEHLFQLGVEFAFVPRLITGEGFIRHVIFTHLPEAARHLLANRPVIMITGHVGNWELMGYAISMLCLPLHAVYRPLDLKPLDRWVQDSRQRRGLTLVNKFGAVRALPPVLDAGLPVGIVADQSGGDRGLFVPFFGRLTSTYKSIGLLALQTNATVICGMARRLAPDEMPPPGAWSAVDALDPRRRWDEHSLRYSIEMTDLFTADEYRAQPDPLFYLTARYRRAIETMVRTAPDQYFWMHRVWRSRPAHERLGKPFPANLRQKLLALPWMTPESVAAVEAQSVRDAANLPELQR